MWNIYFPDPAPVCPVLNSLSLFKYWYWILQREKLHTLSSRSPPWHLTSPVSLASSSVCSHTAPLLLCFSYHHDHRAWFQLSVLAQCGVIRVILFTDFFSLFFFYSASHLSAVRDSICHLAFGVENTLLGCSRLCIPDLCRNVLVEVAQRRTV